MGEFIKELWNWGIRERKLLKDEILTASENEGERARGRKRRRRAS
jgi:hypothetical protein